MAKKNKKATTEIVAKDGTSYRVVMIKRTYGNNPVPKSEYRVVNKDGHTVASAELRREGDRVSSVSTNPGYRRQGIATALYRHIEKHIGAPLKPNDVLTDDGQAFWKSRAKTLSFREKLALNLADWDEADHPRDESGRFAGGGSIDCRDLAYGHELVAKSQDTGGIEHGVAVDPDGKILGRSSGTEDSLDFPDAVRKGTVTNVRWHHNHPVD